MTPFLLRTSAVLLSLVLGGAALAAAAGAGAAAAAGEKRSLQVQRPERAMLMGIARAGNRLVAVGEHGVVALSDDNGLSWRHAAEVPVDARLLAALDAGLPALRFYRA